MERAQKGPNMVFKRSEMEASALMERIIVAALPPVNTIKRGPGPARLSLAVSPVPPR